MIFIVDDDKNILRSLKVVLNREYIVQTCDSATRAVVDIRAQNPDIVVLDIKMPDHDGFWLFAEIRKFNAKVPIIFNSAYQDAVPQEDLTDAFRPFAYLPKNGSLSSFQDVMHRAAKAAGW